MNGKCVMTVMICFIGYIYIYIIFTIYNGISVIIHRHTVGIIETIYWGYQHGDFSEQMGQASGHIIRLGIKGIQQNTWFLIT